MSKIGRNDPCSCMSGKKYKNCCMNKVYIEELEKQNLKYYHEEYILSRIKERSQPFRLFYENERQKIKRELFWLKKVIDSGANMSYGTLSFIEGEPYCIAVKSAPILTEEDFEAAREIQRIICFEQGFKIAKFKQEAPGNYRRVPIRSINDMIYDPMVESHLIKYGFDLAEYYKKQDENHKITIIIQPIEELRPDQVVFITSLYVKKTLQYRNIYPNISDEDISFNKWIKENFEGLVPFSKTILKFVEDTGCKTPDQVEIIFNNIIKSLKLDEALTIDYM